jgi:hypothetical protein
MQNHAVGTLGFCCQFSIDQLPIKPWSAIAAGFERTNCLQNSSIATSKTTPIP